jgi:nicotinamide-nucleotide amidase
MKARITAIGNEILIGQVLDTNSNWLATELTRLGFDVENIAVIPDVRAAIESALSSAEGACDLICFTGGLGPTSDDITKQTFADYFGEPLVMDSEVLADVTAFLARRGRTALVNLNRSQAMVPKGATVLRNLVGTAPGSWFEKDGTVFVSMPGVPYEMRKMMNDEVIPRIREKFDLSVIYQKTVLTFGIPESDLAARIAKWEAALDDIEIAYLPSPAGVRLRLTLRGTDREALKAKVGERIAELDKQIPGDIYGYDTDTLASVVGQLLLGKKKSMATAESCTGGLIGHQITSHPGASAYYLGSIIAYDNRVKIGLLGVNEADIDAHGAVSRRVVESMAEGVMGCTGADYAVATSGIAGPDGGTLEKPVGTVWIAAASKTRTISKRFQFGERRDVNIARSAASALNMLRKLLLEEDPAGSEGGAQ